MVAPDPPRHAAVPLAIGATAVLVPVKAFAEAKRRLHPALGTAERAELARAMTERVLQACGPLPVAVVCDDPAVAEWSRQRGALVVWEPGRGLNGAVEAGVDHLARSGVERVTVAHADLPRAERLWDVDPGDGVVLVPDRFGNGTNVLAVPTDAGFRFSYGPGSFARHHAEACRLGLPVRILERPDLAWDVDEPADVVPVGDRGPVPPAPRALAR
ncbi:MAG: 2-phospho-L-lactate guanylyltransferase [Actinomycetota bacterium]|nr:2-phospho-L-lactate guanylyltransferase [Actinomycetota bacterium]